MQVKIIDVEIENRGKFKMANVTFKNMESGKSESRKIPSFNKNVWPVIENPNKDVVYNVTLAKDDAGYWQWTSITTGQNAPETTTNAPQRAPVASPKSTYETPEERALKQVYIVRQSSLGHAIETLKTDKKAPTKEEVVELATYYEKYVFGNSTLTSTDVNMVLPPLDDDIPT